MLVTTAVERECECHGGGRGRRHHDGLASRCKWSCRRAWAQARRSKWQCQVCDVSASEIQRSCVRCEGSRIREVRSRERESDRVER